jgi:RNA polymerase sigma factor (sigma-70 family)
MGFTPIDVRQAQLGNAESLLHTVESCKAYPSDFVMYRITGYRPKSVSEDMLAGAALQHDLGLLIERVSDTLELDVASQPEPVLSIDDVTEQFNVASKTIQRWRRRGLPARRFTFADGKRRVGFLLSSVERFINAQRQQVMTSANVSLVSMVERERIVRQARRLAVRSRCWEDEIARRLGRRMSRSPLTILHTLRKWDAEHPADAVLPLAAAPLSDAERARISRGARRGRSLKAIARRIGRPRWVVYRALMDRRIDKVSARKVRFIDDPLYHQSDSDEIIRAITGADGGMTAAPSSPLDSRVPRDLPPYLQALYRTPLLSPQQERALFLKFNYHKYRFVQARRKLEPQMARSRELRTLESQLAKATETKNAIVQANLRLVVSVARKHVRPGVSMMELVSDGNLSLIRAAESFDVHRGNKFCTYATLALMKGFARSVPRMQAAGPSVDLAHGLLQSLPDSRMASSNDRLAHRDEVAQLLQRLSGRETQVLMSRFGLNERGLPVAPDEIAVTMGISAQRVRQIEQTALAKLRAVRG